MDQRRFRSLCVTAAIAGALVADAHAGREAASLIYSPILADLNVALVRDRSSYRIEKAEVFTDAGAWDAATTLLANNRVHRLSSQFVERDPRRVGFADISYLVDQSDGSVLSFAAEAMSCSRTRSRKR